MNHFVFTGDVQGGVRLPENGVAEGKGQRELPARKMLQEPLHAAAVELDHAATNAGMTARADAHQANEETKERVRGGPKEGEEAKGHFDGIIDRHDCFTRQSSQHLLLFDGLRLPVNPVDDVGSRRKVHGHGKDQQDGQAKAYGAALQ